MGSKIDAAGIALGVAMLGFLAIFPDKGWVACLGMAAAIGMIAGRRSANFQRIPTLWALALLVAMSLVSLTVTPLPAVGREQLWLLWGGIGAFCVICLWARTRERLILAGVGLSAVGAALSLASPFVVNWIMARKTFVPSAIYEFFPRLLSDPIHPNVMASLMVGVMFVPLAWAIAPPRLAVKPHWLSKALTMRGLWAVAALLPALTLFLTKSRGGYAAGAIGFALLVLLTMRRRRWLLWALLGVLTIGVLAILLQPDYAPLADIGDVEALSTDTFAFRQRVWHYALLLIEDFPFTGVGMRAFNHTLAILYGYRIVNDPGAHNLFLQVALDLGIPGLLAFAALTGIVLFRGARAWSFLRRADDPLWIFTAGVLAGVAATLAQGAVDIAAWGTRGSFLLWCLLGLLAALSAYAQSASPTHPGVH